MQNKKFIFSFFLIVGFSLSLIATLNYFIDPGRIYYLKNSGGKVFEVFNKSKYGISWTGNERYLATLLAQKSKPKDCIAIGSSHIMQLSIIRGPNINRLCKSFLNLGVSGGSIEDLFIFYEILDKNKKLPKKLLLGIDPWTLKWDMDTRYTINTEILSSFLNKNRINKPNFKKTAINSNLLLNLLNFEYTLHTYRFIKREGLNFESSTNFQFQELVENPLSHPCKIPCKLKDGSHQYTKEYLIKNKTDKNYDKKPSYKLNGKYYDEDLILQFNRFLRKIKKDVKIYFILTPYHHNSFKAKFRKFTIYLEKVEKKINLMANELGIKVFGSYSPLKAGCLPTEFYDYMHPNPNCLNKIFKNQI